MTTRNTAELRQAVEEHVAADAVIQGSYYWQFLAQALRNMPVQPAEIQAVVDPVIAGLELLAAGGEWPADAADDVADAAAAAYDEAARRAYAAAAAAAAAAAGRRKPGTPFTLHPTPSMTTATTTDRFPGHQPGEPYELSREEFVLFAGLDRLYQCFVASQPIVGYCGGEDDEKRVAFWAAVAAFEAGRQFGDDNRCASRLCADESEDDGDLSWFYVSTSGTQFYAVESRSGDGEPVFTVEIPVDRDQPGRYHYEQLRQGGTYCD